MNAKFMMAAVYGQYNNLMHTGMMKNRFVSV